MRLDRRTRVWLHLNSALTGVALIAALALVAWLSTRYTIAGDWSTSGRGALSEGSVAVLERLDDRLDVVAFVRPDDLLAGHVERLVARYRAAYPRLRFRAVNPDARPDLARQFGIDGQGQMVVEYQGRQAQVAAPSEARLSAAIAEVSREGERIVAFPVGHGERDLEGRANHDLGSFGDRLGEQGYTLRPVDALADGVPADVSLLVVAGPRAAWSEAARDAVRQWLADGGNLLWLVDDGDRERLAFLAGALGVEIHPGLVVDPRAEELLGVDNPRLLAVSDYAGHPAVAGVEGVSLLTGARALGTGGAASAWEARPLLRSDARHWVETADPDAPTFDPDAGDRRGPVELGWALERAREGAGRQRVVVVGDADFLANAYLGNGANLVLGLGLVDWLGDAVGGGIVPTRAAPDQTLELSRAAMIAMGFGFLLGLPGAWLALAGWAWWRRRRG